MASTASSTGAVPDAPYSDELLADLHADALPADVSERLWPLVRADADAMRVIAALDAVTKQLHDIGEDLDGTLPVPPEVAERIDRTIASPNTATVHRLRPRRTPFFIGIAAVATVLAAVSIAVAVGPWRSQPETAPIADGPDLVIDADTLDSGVAFTVIGKRDPGALADPRDLAACLQANDIDPATTVLGSSRVRIDGRSGTLLVLSGGGPSRLVALAVGNGCGPGNPDVLTRRDIG